MRQPLSWANRHAEIFEAPWRLRRPRNPKSVRVVSKTLHVSKVTAHANVGYSGRPCLERHGRVFGMVTGALGEVKKNEEFENVEFAPWYIAMS